MKLKKSIRIALAVFLFLLFAAGTAYYLSFHPARIVEGENRYSIGSYSLPTKGLLGFSDLIAKSEGMPGDYNVSYFEAALSESGTVRSFTLSLDTFDESGQFAGTAGYTYRGHTLTYTPPVPDHLALVRTLDQNRALGYLSAQLTALPLRQELSLCGLPHYVLRYQPETIIDAGAPIFDCRGGSCQALGPEDYNAGKGGVSDGATSVVFRLYNGESIAVGQQYLFVCRPTDASAAVGVRESTMQCDYYINGKNELQFTRDYGQSWLPCDLTPANVEETLSYYRSISLPVGSWFLSPDERLPIAVFYGGNPILHLSGDNGANWEDIPFPTAADFGRDITRRFVGFLTPKFGWAALGTDWSMGAGEGKRCYFTADGGKTWAEKALPLQNSPRTLTGFAMADEKNGVMALDAESFPLLYATADSGASWQEADISFDGLPEKVQYLTSVDSLTLADSVYTLTLGQGNAGIIKAAFTASSPLGPWTFSGASEGAVHTVG